MNPAHLFLGTASDNTADMVAKGRKVVARGEQLPQAKLTAEIVLEIRRLGASGSALSDIAAQFGISRRHASRVVRRETWAHL